MWIMFKDLARESAQQMDAIEARLHQLGAQFPGWPQSGDNPTDLEQIHSFWEFGQQHRALTMLLTRHALSTILFASMALEGFINDYAARHIGESRLRDLIEKWDLVDKWRYSPRFVVGQDLNGGGRGLEHLRLLVKARNDLVHYKSRPIPLGPKPAPVDVSDLQGLTQVVVDCSTGDTRIEPLTEAEVLDLKARREQAVPDEEARLKGDPVAQDLLGKARAAIEAIGTLAIELDAVDPSVHASSQLGPSPWLSIPF